MSASRDGFVVESPDGAYRLRIGGVLQGDGRFYLSDVPALGIDSFLLRTARPTLQGTVASRFDFSFVPDFGQGTSVIQDAYVDSRFSSALRLRVGKFKTPFGLERLQAESNLLFVERALPNDIVPNRDVGLQLHGEVGGGVLSYAAALMNGAPDGASLDADVNDSKDAAVRVFAQPFKFQTTGGALKGLGMGLAATVGRQTGPVLPNYRTPGQLVFFNYLLKASADGTRWRLSPQASLYCGSVGVIAEYARSTQTVRMDTRSAPITNAAWQVAASWLVTGERATSGTLRPLGDFDPGHGTWGAFELAARVHGLQIDDDAFAQGFADSSRSARKATAWGVGLNWYLNRNIKYVADFERTGFDGGSSSGNRKTENIFLFRCQIAI